MKGIIINLLENMVTEKFGENVYPNQGGDIGMLPNMPPRRRQKRNYNRELQTMLAALSNQFKLPREIILYEAGRYIFREFVRKYPRNLKTSKTPVQFLLSVENLLSSDFRQYFVDDEMPIIRVSKTGVNQAQMQYSSANQVCTLVEGILRGVAEYFGKEITYNQPSCMDRGDEYCCFNLQFHDKILN